MFEVPARYATATLDGLNSAPLRKVVREYGARYGELKPKGVAPFFCGSTQGYKTYAAAVLVGALARVGEGYAWCHVGSAFPPLDRDAFSERTSTHLRTYRNADFLVLDDFTQCVSPRVRDWLVEIGTFRFDTLRPTLYTGNVRVTAKDFTELGNVVGVGLARRILEASEGFRVSVRGG